MDWRVSFGGIISHHLGGGSKEKRERETETEPKN